LKKREEFFYRDPSVPDKFTEGSSIQLFVVRDGKMAAGWVVVDHMRALVVIVREVELGECLSRFST